MEVPVLIPSKSKNLLPHVYPIQYPFCLVDRELTVMFTSMPPK